MKLIVSFRMVGARIGDALKFDVYLKIQIFYFL